ncbi:MAG: hypothetical protein M5U09_25170, partial [Gammaproteobacteria bacterium]|nr:hypothetical protein [Gammaproteobacteria bacterium]
EACDVRIGRGIECFPRQNGQRQAVSRGQYGVVAILVWRDGRRQSIPPRSPRTALSRRVPDSFERLAVARLQDILAQVPDDIRRFVLKTKGGLKEASTPKVVHPPRPAISRRLIPT